MAISTSMVDLATVMGIFALLAISLNIKFGFTGLLEIGHVAFYLIGAYVTALLVLPPPAQSSGQVYLFGAGLPWIVAIPIAMGVCAVFGALVSLPAIRLREDFLAIVLLGMAFIVQQIFRSERWLANGPRALTGYERPLNQAFPVPAAGREGLLGIPPEPLSAIVFGGILAFFVAIAVLLLRRWDGFDDPDTSPVVAGVFVVTTLGVGYAAARVAGESDASGYRYAAGAGVAVGGAVAVLNFLLQPFLAQFLLLVVLGALSLFSWSYAVVVFRDYYGELSRRELGTGAVLSLLFLATFLPLVLLGSSDNELLGVVGMIGWLALLSGYIYGLYWLAGRWDAYGDGTDFIRVVGVAAVAVFLVRYFVLALVPTLSSRGVLGAVFDFAFNLLWLAKFDLGRIVTILQGGGQPVAVTFGYNRFLFGLVVAAVVVVYVLTEITIKSPFGRVLKAIREDEDVATALGKNTFLFKVQSMAVGSAIAGLAGGLAAIQFGALTWSIFRIEVTFFALLMVIIGGTANNRGAILGAIIFWGFSRGTNDIAGFFPEAAGSSIQALRLVIIGALLIVILYYRPEGIWGEEHGTVEAGEGPPVEGTDDGGGGGSGDPAGVAAE